MGQLGEDADHERGADRGVRVSAVQQADLRAHVLEALDAGPLDDTLPQSLLRRFDLVDFADAVRLLHRPQTGKDPEAAWRRMKFDELLAQQLSMRFAYRKRRARRRAGAAQSKRHAH